MFDTKSTAADTTEFEQKRSLSEKLRNYFFAGVLVTAPIGITVYFTWLFIKYIDVQVSNLFPDSIDHEQLAIYHNIPGIGLIIVIVFLILVGWITASFFGRFLITVTQFLMARVPVARSIYGVSRQVLETIVSKRASSFNEVVLVEYPRKESWAIGFVTGKTQGQIQKLSKGEVMNVFLPTTPNPTSGFLLFIPRKDMIKLDMSVEEGIKMVISGGIVGPNDKKITAKSKPKRKK